MRRLPRRLIIPAFLLFVACEVSAPVPAARLWTVFDFAAGLVADKHFGPKLSPLFAGGFAARDLLSDSGQVRMAPAFSEGLAAAYVTTEIWAGYPAVWVQPMYVLTTGWDATARRWTPLGDARAIFSVGPDSGFYSPYWQIFWVVVPDGTPPDQYRSERQVLNDKLPLHPGPAKLCPLVPTGISVEGGAAAGKGWLDGADIDVLDFGLNRFTWNDRREIEEQPLFVLSIKDEGGFAHPATGLPTIGGTGPLFERRPAIAPNNRPRFGSLWRLYSVALPNSAGVLIPPGAEFDALRARVTEVSAPTLSPSAMASPNLKDYAGRVALDRSCFSDPAVIFPGACTWLDSQAKIEDNLPAAIVRSEILATCPLVVFAGKPVP